MARMARRPEEQVLHGGAPMKQMLMLWVSGAPVAQGSMRSPKAGVVLHGSENLTAWRDQIAWAAKDKWRGKPLIDAPVKLDCQFHFNKPQRPRHEWWRDTAPDLDKLIRAVGDALEGVVLKNDARIAMVTASKHWTVEPPHSISDAGVFITLEELS